MTGAARLEDTRLVRRALGAGHGLAIALLVAALLVPMEWRPALSAAGVLALVATPILGVLAAAVVFARSREWGHALAAALIGAVLVGFVLGASLA